MKTIYFQNSCKELELLRVSCKKNTISIDWIYIQSDMSAQKVINLLNLSWVENLSDSEIYKEKQIRQKRQKTASFLEKTKESEATTCLK